MVPVFNLERKLKLKLRSSPSRIQWHMQRTLPSPETFRITNKESCKKGVWGLSLEVESPHHHHPDVNQAWALQHKT